MGAIGSSETPTLVARSAAALASSRTVSAASDATLAVPGTHAGTTVSGLDAASASRRAVTVLPRMVNEDGQLRLSHEPRERYETERVLGEGGMGIVALAHDRDIDRRVALKRIRREIGEHGLARFAEEVRTIGSLEHPNIVPVHDVGVDENGDYFFVMKYVDGQTLEQIIEQLAAGDPQAVRRFSFETRVQIFIGLLRAIAYAHDRGIIHRDIKPANIIVGRYGEVVLMDWGIARRMDGTELPAAPEQPGEDTGRARERLVQTQGGGLIGTPAYMSPEQAAAAPDLDGRSDLYSACVVFFELITLRHYLADKTTVAAILAGVLERELPPVHRADLYTLAGQPPPPAEYVHIVRRGMHKDPAGRWSSAHDLIEVLEAALEGRIAVQCPVTFSKRVLREAGRFVDRHPRTAVGLLFGSAAGVVLGLAAAVLALAT